MVLQAPPCVIQGGNYLFHAYDEDDSRRAIGIGRNLASSERSAHRIVIARFIDGCRKPDGIDRDGGHSETLGRGRDKLESLALGRFGVGDDDYFEALGGQRGRSRVDRLAVRKSIPIVYKNSLKDID